MLTLIVIVKAISEIALLALLGQWVLGLVCGLQRSRNPFYRLLQTVGQPAVALARWVSPRRWVQDRHVPWVALILVTAVWMVVTLAKVVWCLNHGLSACR